MKVHRKQLIYLLFFAFVSFLATGSSIKVEYQYALRHARSVEEKVTTLKMIFAGDIMAHEVNYTRRPYDPIYEDIRDFIWDADLSFANLEFVFDPNKPPHGYPHFNAPVDYVKAAIRAGFNVFSLANNHSLDMGSESIVETLAVVEELLREHRLYFSGVCAQPEERFKPLFFDIAGVKVGFLAVTSFLNTLVDNEKVHVVPYYNEVLIDEFIRGLASQTAQSDLFILSYHGGVEYAKEPAQWQRDLFGRFIDSGVDVVWGHHPHVVQPWETVMTPRGEKLILYSTGNLISGQSWNSGPKAQNPGRDGTGEAALFSAELVIRGKDAAVRRVNVIPIFNHRDPESGMVIKRFGGISFANMNDEWAAYYRGRLEDMETRLFDSFSWGFVK